MKTYRSKVQVSTGYLRTDEITTGEAQQIRVVQDIKQGSYFNFNLEKKEEEEGYEWWEGYMISPDFYAYGFPPPYDEFLFDTEEYKEGSDFTAIHPSYSPRFYLWTSIEGYPSTLYSYTQLNIDIGKTPSLAAPLLALKNGYQVKSAFGVDITKVEPGEKEEDHPAFFKLVNFDY